MVTKYEYYDTGDDGIFGITLFTGDHQAQTFLVGATPHDISYVRVKLVAYSSNTSYSVTAKLRATSGGSPTTLIATSTAKTGTLGTTPTDIDISFSPKPHLNKNTTYAIQLDAQPSGPLAWRADYSSPSYSDGSRFYSGNESSWTASTGEDFMFAIYGDPLVLLGVNMSSSPVAGKLLSVSATNKVQTTNSGGKCYYYSSSPASGKTATKRVSSDNLDAGKLIDD